jgi:hypothetical protein
MPFTRLNRVHDFDESLSYGYGGLMTAEFRANDLLMAAEMRTRRGRPQ